MPSAPTTPQAPPVAPAKPGSPRPPQVAPKPASNPIAPRANEPSDLADASWDDAPTATSMPEPETAKGMPKPSIAVVEPEAQSATNPTFTKPMPERTKTGPMAAGMPANVREEVWAIVRAAVETATAPLLQKQQDLEVRLERMDREVKALSPRPPAVAPPPPPAAAPTASQSAQAIPPAPGVGASSGTSGSSAASKLAAIAPATKPMPSIPVTMGSASIPPIAPHPPPRIEEATIPAMRPRADSAPVSSSGRSLPPQGYGVVVVPPGPRPSIDLDSVAIGPDDYAAFDGGRKKKIVVRVVIAVLLLVIVGVVLSTILSYAGPPTQ